MTPRSVVVVALLVLAGCAADPGSSPEGSRTADPSADIDPQRAAMQVSCGGPGFPASLLDAPGDAELGDDPAAEALRRHLAQSGSDFDWLPDSGWREVSRTETQVTYVADAAAGSDAPYASVEVSRNGEAWRVGGWGQCRLQADVGPDLGLATFRVAPGVALTPDLTEIDVLVTERACNSGQDARGRIVEPAVIADAASVTVVFAVHPRGGMQDCQSNPETPFVLTLPEPLGDRVLLDGSESPPRDATLCADNGICAP